MMPLLRDAAPPPPPPPTTATTRASLSSSSNYVSGYEERLNALLSSSSNDETKEDSSFSVVEYLNLALQLPPNDINNDDVETDGRSASFSSSSSSSSQQQQQQQRLAELALQLQLQTTNCHEEIGRVSAELQAILPRCATDVSRLGTGLAGLQHDVQHLFLQLTTSTSSDQHEEGRAAERQTSSSRGDDDAKREEEEAPLLTMGGDRNHNQNNHSSSLETLSMLHSLQANLARTKDILTAAATWDATLHSIPLLLSQQQIDKAVAAWAELKLGQEHLQGMPTGDDERKQQIVKIQTQIMNLLAPQLQHAISNMNAGRSWQPLQHCVSMYAQLGTLDVLQKEYIKHRPSHVHKLWFDYSGSGGASSSQRNNTSIALVQWLPNWLDAVLQLVTEEIRQSSTLFGPSHVPAMTVSVLKECFRPIKASFCSRLESLCNSSNSSRAGGGGGSGENDNDLEGLCAVYESILQFLSLAYNTIVGSFQDLVEAGHINPSTNNNKNNLSPSIISSSQQQQQQLYQDLIDTFVLVTGPFAVYQERFATLESAYSSKIVSQLAEEMQLILNQCTRASKNDDDEGEGKEDTNASSSTSSLLTVEGLTTATDELLHVATKVFATAEGSLARYELLLGGYHVASALASMDTMVSSHLHNVTAAVSTLTRLTHQSFLALTTPATQQHLDESVVTASLYMLHIAGTVMKRVSDFCEQTQQRLNLLNDRLASLVAQEVDNKTTILPDALSPVDIDSIIIKMVCANVFREDTATAHSVLNRLVMDAKSNTTTTTTALSVASLFPQSHDAVQSLCRACQLQVFDTCSAVPLRHLTAMSSMTCWKEGADGGSSAAGSEYGTLPQSYMTQVGEHMLALVQALEPFASNHDELSLAIPAMTNLRQVAMSPWNDFLQATGINSSTTDGDSIVVQLVDGKTLVNLVSVTARSPSYDEDEEDKEAREENQQDESSKAIASFCNAWLDAVGCAVTGRLVERIMRIPSLSAKGCEHLHADLNYLVNVLTALGVSGHPHPLLSHVAELATLNGDALAERMARRNRTHPLEAALASMEDRLAAIRGVSARYNY